MLKKPDWCAGSCSGASREKLEELMRIVSAYAGFPVAVEGMRELREKLD